jgi:hypothetical protein
MSVTRHGINRRESGPLSKCSFEETVEVLHDAGRYSQKDPLQGVTEAIIVGKRPPVGTGKFGLYLNVEMLQNAIPMPEFEVPKQEEEAYQNQQPFPIQERQAFEFHPEPGASFLDLEFAPSSPIRV